LKHFNLKKDAKIALIGLGYVGLPLAVEFGLKYKTVGFDINLERIKELKKGNDKTLEISKDKLLSTLSNGNFFITADANGLKDCNIYIITVPTPIDKYNIPDLTPLYKASELVGKYLKNNDIVIYESTVYPGATEEECVPVLEKVSGLRFNFDFYVGYSPERINPGDKLHTVTNIKKLTSGSTEVVAEIIDKLYLSIIKAGTFKTTSIKVAEAAKVIENSQRDINIAFVNELSKIFSRLSIDTNEVLEAASTKWNFLPFKPGLVGGHCIGVDPFYLAQKAMEVGYHPEIILAGRRINDGMGKYVVTEVVKLMLKKNLKINGSNALILGFTFKENCPDVRNTKVIDIYNELLDYNMNIDVYDPWISIQDFKHEFNFEIKNDLSRLKIKKYQVIIVAVGHSEFKKIKLTKNLNQVIYDVKSFYSKEIVDARL